MPIGKKKPLHTGVRTGCHYLITLSSVSVRVKFVVFTDRESCTRPISTNPGSMEAGEYELTRGTCFLACRLDWTRSPGCCGFRGVFWVGQIFFPCFFFRFFFSFERTRPAASTRPHLASCTSLLGRGCVQGAII